MLIISFELVPWTHRVFMIICWGSIFVYIRILFILNTKRHNEFKSSFFLIIKLHAITDILMFLFVEFVARPRKYRIHNLLSPINDNWLPQLIYFTQTAIKNTMFLGYIVVAANRFTVIFQLKYQSQLWSPMIIAIIYVFEWLAPSSVLLHIFYNTGNHNFSFLPSSNGGLSLRTDPDFMKIDALQDFILSTVSFLVSSIFYLLTIVLVVKNLKYPPPAFPAPNMLVKTKRFTLSPTEMLIFKCAFGSFLLFVPNFVKTTVLYFATDPLVVNAATDLWYFTTELMCVSSAWSLLLSSRRIREEFVPEMRNPFLERSTIGSTSRVLTM